MEVKLIFTAKLARALLRKGYRVVDIKENRKLPGKTVFVFEDRDGIKEDIRELSRKTK